RSRAPALAEARSRPVEARLDGAGRDAEQLRGLPLGETLELAQHDHRALLGLEVSEAVEQLNRQLRAGRACGAVAEVGIGSLALRLARDAYRLARRDRSRPAEQRGRL